MKEKKKKKKMGVEGFFGWLSKRYPIITKNLSICSYPPTDYFFIDFNCIIHNATNVLLKTNDINQVFNEIFRFINTLVHFVNPSTTVFIAVDGPVPLAKMIQQRERRFKIKNINKDSFSKNSISIGTEFMNQLDKKFLNFLNDRIKNDPLWEKLDIIYSSYHVPGEGEHKIFDFIRNQRNLGLWNENCSISIYSPDSDMIFICLQNKINNCYIIREKIFNENNLYFNNILFNDTG